MKGPLILLLIVLIFTSLSCDPITGMHRKISLMEDFPHSCVDQAAEKLFIVHQVNHWNFPKGSFDSHVFTRGNAHVELQVYTNPAPKLILGFSHMGFPDQARDAECVRLLNDVQQVLLQECNMPQDQLKIVDECMWMKCPK